MKHRSKYIYIAIIIIFISLTVFNAKNKVTVHEMTSNMISNKILYDVIQKYVEENLYSQYKNYSMKSKNETPPTETEYENRINSITPFSSIRIVGEKQINENKFEVYAMIAIESFREENGSLLLENGSVMHYKFTVIENERDYSIIKCENSEFIKDLTKMFTKDVVDEFNKIEGLVDEVRNKAYEYYNIYEISYSSNISESTNNTETQSFRARIIEVISNGSLIIEPNKDEEISQMCETIVVNFEPKEILLEVDTEVIIIFGGEVVNSQPPQLWAIDIRIYER